VADPANDYIWLSLCPVILYISRMGNNVLAQHKKVPALTGTFWRLLYNINIEYFLFCFCCCSWKQVVEPKIHKCTRILLVQILLMQLLKLFGISASIF